MPSAEEHSDTEAVYWSDVRPINALYRHGDITADFVCFAEFNRYDVVAVINL